MQATKTTLLSLAAMAMLAGCSPPPAAAVNAASGALAAAGQEYRPAPELLGGGVTGDGQVQLYGSAAPGAVVRLSSPTGANQFATADARGVWRAVLAPSVEPRLLGLSMLDNSRVVQAVGYLFLAPDGSVVRLRAGGGTEAAAPEKPGLAALALDYDNQRAATLSGVAGPHETVRIRVDGVERGQASADSAGRFVLPLSQQLKAGLNDFDLSGAAQEVRFSTSVGAPAPLGKARFAATRAGQGWRVDWLTLGGGEQTTLILGPPGVAS